MDDEVKLIDPADAKIGPRSKERVWTNIVATLVASIASLITGYVLAFSSPTEEQLKDKTEIFFMTEDEFSLFTVSSTIPTCFNLASFQLCNPKRNGLYAAFSSRLAL